jgi:hypothetical protein
MNTTNTTEHNMEIHGNTTVLTIEIDGWVYSLIANNPPAAMSPGGTIFFKGKMA